jgi:hypothetical protein
MVAALRICYRLRTDRAQVRAYLVSQHLFQAKPK